ncbi:MAG: hypothetical protein KKA67_00005 [Spirochaetes bacterium]|nr:hypothetical protein [Spirochaetota bacterium]
MTRKRTPVSIALVAAAAALGVALWLAMRLCQGAARGAVGTLPEWAALAANAGIEEALRLGLALAIAYGARRLGLEPGVAGLGVLASCVLATLENAAYLARFPSFDSYWRLGYSLPIHAAAAALYALAAGARPSVGSSGAAGPGGAGRRAAAIAAAFAAAWAWHSAFNVVAALAPFPALPLVGTALNAIVLSALVVASAIRYGYWSVYAAR